MHRQILRLAPLAIAFPLNAFALSAFAQATTPEPGAYACTYDTWTGAGANRQRRSEEKGAVTLQRDGTYKWLDNGGSGKYRLDAKSGEIAWLSGPIANMKPEKTTYRRNQRTTQIDIRFKGSYEWSCGHNL